MASATPALRGSPRGRNSRMMETANMLRCSDCGCPNPEGRLECYSCGNTLGPNEKRRSRVASPQVVSIVLFVLCVIIGGVLGILAMLWVWDAAGLACVLTPHFPALTGLLVCVVILVVGCVTYLAYAGIKGREALERAMDAVPGFRATQKVVASNESALAVDEHAQRICFVSRAKDSAGVATHVVPYSAVIECEVVEEKASTTDTGFAGLLITTTRASKLYLKTVVNDSHKPTHLTYFLIGPPADTSSKQYREKLELAQHWHGLLTVAARRAEQLGQLSPADELQKLAALRSEGIITEDEWERSKELYLGKEPNKREEAVRILHDLHSLLSAGVLSEAEFNMKKWDVLSRKDI